jgi:SulP family sulfate permease
VSYAAGERLIEQGALSQDILFIESGRVAVIQDAPGSAPLRLKSMGAGTVVGEITFYVAGPRSASVVALEPTTAYLLSGDAMRRMQREHPQQASEFHAFMAKTLALKLVETNRLVGALNA